MKSSTSFMLRSWITYVLSIQCISCKYNFWLFYIFIYRYLCCILLQKNLINSIVLPHQQCKHVTNKRRRLNKEHRRPLFHVVYNHSAEFFCNITQVIKPTILNCQNHNLLQEGAVPLECKQAGALWQLSLPTCPPTVIPLPLALVQHYVLLLHLDFSFHQFYPTETITHVYRQAAWVAV